MNTTVKPLTAALALFTLVASGWDANAQSRRFFCGEESYVTVTVTGNTTIYAGPIDGQMRTLHRGRNDRLYFLQGGYGIRIMPNQTQIKLEIPDFGTIDCVHRVAGGRPGGNSGAALAFPHRAKSWGGSVRSGPGVGHRKIASLREGERISILQQSNAPYYQDRPWFKIRFRGRTGYQWGGIICPLGSSVPGTFQVCN